VRLGRYRASVDFSEATEARLLAAGFESVAPAASSDSASWHRSERQLSKFGRFTTVIAAAKVPPDLPASDLEAKSRELFASARSLAREIGPSPNLLLVYTLLLTNRCRTGDEFLKEYRPRHWKAAEVPVIFDPANGTCDLNRKTPIWGAAYHKRFVREAEDLFREGGINRWAQRVL